MICHYHPDRQAVELCKHCQRGLCSDCAALINDSRACKNRHEEQVRALEQMTAHNILQAKRIGSSYFRSAVFYGLAGLLFTGFGAIQLKWPGLQAVNFLMMDLFLPIKRDQVPSGTWSSILTLSYFRRFKSFLI